MQTKGRIYLVTVSIAWTLAPFCFWQCLNVPINLVLPTRHLQINLVLTSQQLPINLVFTSRKLPINLVITSQQLPINLVITSRKLPTTVASLAYDCLDEQVQHHRHYLQEYQISNTPSLIPNT